MAKSLKQVQAELLTEGYIDQRSADRVDRSDKPIEQQGITDLMVRVAAEFILAVQDNLTKSGKVSTGGLLDGLGAGEVVTDGTTYSIDIGYDPNDPAAKYWDFVNQGVKGLVSGEPSASPYQFRKLSAPPVMVNAIRGWLRTNNIAARNEDQKTNLSGVQRKRARISAIQDPEGNFAYAIALTIKRQGLPRTLYFSRAVQEYFGKDFTKAMAAAVGADIRVAIRKFNPSQNA